MPSDNHLHSDVKEIMVTKPGWVLRHGNKIIMCLLVTVLIAATLFSYPETIATDLELISLTKSETLRAPEGNHGVHLLLVEDHQEVHTGMPLLVWEDEAGTDYQELLKLEKQLHVLAEAAGTETAAQPVMLQTAKLGNLAPAYEALRKYGPLPALLDSTQKALTSWKAAHVAYASVGGVVRLNYIFPRTGIPLAADSPVLYLEQADTAYVGIGRVASADFSRVKPGQQVLVQLQELGQESLLGEVLQVAPLAEAQQHRVVFLVHTPSHSRINATYTGTARILVENKSLMQKMIAN